MTSNVKSPGPDGEILRSSPDLANHCVILGGTDFALQVGIVLSSMGIQVTCVDEAQRVPDTVTFGLEGFVWEGQSRVGWNYLPLLSYFSIPVDSKVIQGLIEECRHSDVKYLWYSGPHSSRRPLSLYSPDLADLRPYNEESEVCFQLISKQFAEWCRAWLSQLSWQSEQVERARVKRANKIALQQARRASKQPRKVSGDPNEKQERSAQGASSRSVLNSPQKDTVGIPTHDRMGLGDWIKSGAIRYKMAGKRWEPATAPTWIGKSLRRNLRALGRTSKPWSQLYRHWCAPDDLSKWTATEWRLENLKNSYRHFLGLERPAETPSDQVFQVSALLERLKGLPDFEKLSTYWLPGQTSQTRHRKLRDYAEEAGVVFLKVKGQEKVSEIQSLRIHREGGAVRGVSIFAGEKQELRLESAAVVLVDPQLKGKFTDEPGLKNSAKDRLTRLCTLCFQFASSQPPLGNVRSWVHWKGQELELEWAELSRLELGIKSGFVLWVRFTLSDSWDGKSESCRLIAKEVFEFLLQTFPGQFMGMTRFFPDARSSHQWETDSKLLGGTPVRVDRDSNSILAEDSRSSLGEGLFIMTPEANYGLGRWGNFIKMVELGVWWSHRLAIPWQVKNVTKSSESQETIS